MLSCWMLSGRDTSRHYIFLCKVTSFFLINYKNLKKSYRIEVILLLLHIIVTKMRKGGCFARSYVYYLYAAR